MKGLAGVHDFDAQLDLLVTLHGWAESAVADLVAVYGDDLAISLGPVPTDSTQNPGFSVTLGDNYGYLLATERRRRAACAGSCMQ
jgi:hypothetical protein